MLVKICGTTSPHDALLAARAGADYLGLILEHPRSPRSIALETALQIRAALEAEGLSTTLVAVTVNLPVARLLEINEKLAPQVFQLHGDETPSQVEELTQHALRVWSTTATAEDASTLLAAGTEAVVVDARATTQSGETIYGGTGKTSDWSLAKSLVESGARVVLSGGLDAQNVATAIAQVHPWLVDAVSGVEAQPGIKDANKVLDFLRHAKNS